MGWDGIRVSSVRLYAIKKRTLGPPRMTPLCLCLKRWGSCPDAWRWYGEQVMIDDPPRGRTAELRALGFPTRHLGPAQMMTDTALGVTKRVIVDRGSLFFFFF
jgi:Predicted SAM-dependent RNA methyltransferase